MITGKSKGIDEFYGFIQTERKIKSNYKESVNFSQLSLKEMSFTISEQLDMLLAIEPNNPFYKSLKFEFKITSLSELQKSKIIRAFDKRIRQGSSYKKKRIRK